MQGNQIHHLSNMVIAQRLDELADLVAASGENEFRARAYHKAARVIAETRNSLAEMVSKNENLTELPGVGESIASKIKELVSTGHCAYLDSLRQTISPEIEELLQVPGLGPARFRVLHDELGIMNRRQLLQHALNGDIHELKGFGTELEREFIESLEGELRRVKRYSLPFAQSKAEALLKFVQKLPCTQSATMTGSFRRRKDTLGDLDLLVESMEPAALVQSLAKYKDVDRTVAIGTTKASFQLKSGIQLDVRIVPGEAHGAALLHLTGSKAHNIALRQRAASRGLNLNEYGLFRGNQRIAGRTEASVYAALGLEYILPELRENNGEIEAAEARTLPRLIQTKDLLGDLHCHTNASDGACSLEVLVAAAVNRGLEYMAITDHVGGDDVRHAISESALKAQLNEIDKLNSLLKSFEIFKGAEVDVHVDGSLACRDEMLDGLDLVICSINSYARLSREDQTARMIRVIENPRCNILAHPTGRLLMSQSPLDVDMLRVIRAAAAKNVVLEVNGHPSRLDLFDSYCRMAKAEGAWLSLTADVHAPCDFHNVAYAVDQARRGWVESCLAINTRSREALRLFLRKKSV